MTKTNALRKFIEEFYGITLNGNTVSQILAELTDKQGEMNETIVFGKGTDEEVTLTGRQVKMLLENVKQASTVIDGQEQNFDTLEAAISAANGAASAATVYVNKDTEVAAAITVSKDMTLKLAGCKLESPTGGVVLTVTSGATVTIDGSANGSGVYGRINLGTAPNNNGSVIINGGNFSCAENQTCLHINGTCTESNVTIKNAVIYSPTDNGIQLNGSGEFVLDGCKITGATGVYVKSGKVTITGCEITGTMEPANYEYYGSGANATGDGIVIDSCEYPGGAPEVFLGKGNVITGTKNDVGYYEYDTNKDGVTVKGTVETTNNSFSVADQYEWKKDGDKYVLGLK